MGRSGTLEKSSRCFIKFDQNSGIDVKNTMLEHHLWLILGGRKMTCDSDRIESSLISEKSRRSKTSSWQAATITSQ
jgi:hypothetical protein